MTHVGAQQIRFRCAVAAVNVEDHIRVYSQDTSGGIREARCENDKWSGGDDGSIVKHGILGTPIAAICRDTNRNMHVFYIGEGNVAKQMYRDERGRWQDGNLNQMNIRVAPYSMMCSCFVEDSDHPMRLYVQMVDNSIQEYGCDKSRQQWSQMTSIGPAQPGTGLACTVTPGRDKCIRLFLQDENMEITERRCQDGRHWKDGNLSIQKASPRTDLTAIQYKENEVHVYYVAHDNHIKQMWTRGDHWSEGEFNKSCVPGSQVAAVSWGSQNGWNIRVYFQEGHQITAITEWKYDGRKWEEGRKGLPPAQ